MTIRLSRGSVANLGRYPLNPFSAGTVIRRQNLTSVDVRFWRLKTVPALKELKKSYWPWTHNIGIQMKREELTKICMTILNNKKPFDLHGLYNNISAL